MEAQKIKNSSDLSENNKVNLYKFNILIFVFQLQVHPRLYQRM